MTPSLYRSMFLTLCAAIAFAGAALAVASSIRSGPAWDDPLEIKVMNAEIQIGAMPGLDYAEAKARYGDTNRGHVFYGVAMQYAAHAITSWLDGQKWTVPEAPTVRNIAVRHVLTVIVALIGAGILSVTAAVISGRVELGFAVAAILMSTPVFVGQSAINVKDVPAGIGITIFSCGAALLFLVTQRARAVLAAATALMLAGVFLAVGTRAGAVALIGFEAAILAVLLVARTRIREAAAMAAGLGAGLLLAALTNPFGRKAPFEWLWEAVAFSPVLSTPIPTTLYGVKVQSTALPWWYVPGWIVVEYTLPFLLLAVIGAVAAVSRIKAERLESMLAWSPFVIQGLVLPLIIIVVGATLYDRLRHLFFIVPPFCLLAAFGLLVCYSGVARGGLFRAAALPVLGAVCLLLNFGATVLWHPYQYAYLNALGRSFPDYTFDTDYWGLSVAEAMELMKDRGASTLRAGPAPVFLSYSLGQGIAVQAKPSHIPFEPGFYYYIHSRPSWRATGLPESCRTLFEIRRQGVNLGVGGQC